MSTLPDPDTLQAFAATTEASALRSELERHVVSMLGNDFRPPRRDTYFQGLAYCVRTRLIEKWLRTQRTYYDSHAKRVYYLSLEFLPGPFLKNYVQSLGLERKLADALAGSGFSLDELADEERDPGLGNGGLGRLASCFMDSLACLGIPGHGYGIRYDYGIFRQKIVNGWQVEECDNWLVHGNPWEITRRGFLYNVHFFGRSESLPGDSGSVRRRWVDTENVSAMPCDILVPGYGGRGTTNMRLWAAVSSTDFNLEFFNQGDYIRAMQHKVLSENITKVLYPSDEGEAGKELRLKQQYFFVAATFQDIFRRFRKTHSDFSELPDSVAIQLNDTHPAIAIPELMRILVDDEGLAWDAAWDISVRTFAYTNHTVMPEALETWPVSLMSRLLPRHMEIIYEINRRFLDEVARRHPGDVGLIGRLSLIGETPEKRVRMAHLAIVGSHAVNGVAALHTHILKTRLFADFDRFFPGRILNVTNGISPRRWLLQANPPLAALIGERIRGDWVLDLNQLRGLEACADDPDFRARWRATKTENKRRLAAYIARTTGVRVDTGMLFDVQIKRIHEYKRQILSVLHAVTLYNRIKDDPAQTRVARAIIFGGKAAPSYRMAKLTIKLINAVAERINGDPDTQGRLAVVFLPDYCVSLAERVIPAADLSEQISTAGLEASGTGNMKFALNGALTIGTLDGANIEIREEVGQDNMFVFGLTADQIESARADGYAPRRYYDGDPELKRAIDMIASGVFSPDQPDLFVPIRRALIDEGDRYFVLADYRSYVDAQGEVDRVFVEPDEWARRSILNVARMGKFSSDRAILEYATKIWGIAAG
jgi:starch phosphorylase